MGRTALTIDGLSVDFEGFKAVNQVTMTIDDGELRVLLGANGAGKTTLMDLISGKTKSTSGRVFLHDTKRNLSSFRCDVRVEVAKQLLMHEDYKLDRVAEMTGFVDGSHLSRVFRLHTGRSPGRYRIESDRLAQKHSTASMPVHG